MTTEELHFREWHHNVVCNYSQELANAATQIVELQKQIEEKDYQIKKLLENSEYVEQQLTEKDKQIEKLEEQIERMEVMKNAEIDKEIWEDVYYED